MSVRRLADEKLQPEGFKFNRQMAAEAKTWIKKYPKGREQSAVIPLLMLAQDQDGWVTRAAIEHISQMLDMPKIRVMEVATFYTQFQLKPVGARAHVQVCGTTPCMLRGAEDLRKVCQNRIHHDPFALSDNGALSWEEVECQGACVNAPMVMIGKDTYEDLTPERLEEIIDAFEAGKGDTIAPGPQIDRIFSAPVGGPITLLNGGAAGTKGTVSSTMKLASTASAVKPKPAEGKRDGGNATMRLASTASGVNKKAPAPIEPPAKKAAKPAAKPKAEKKAAPKTQSEPVTYDKDKLNPTMKLASTSSSVKPKTTSPKTPPTAGRPAGIEKPAKPDNLKMISGIGPKIEGILHSLGIWTFSQIAAWKKAERDWVDDHLKFKGRIEREGWVRQAKALAKGGRDEYFKVFGKEPR